MNRVLEAVLNGVLQHADHTPYSPTARLVVMWLEDTRLHSWTVGGLHYHPQDWWATRLGISRRSLQYALRELVEPPDGEMAVVSVTHSKQGHRRMTTYVLRDEFRQVAERYATTILADAKARGTAGMAKANRAVKAQNLWALRAVMDAGKVPSDADEQPEQEAESA